MQQNKIDKKIRLLNHKGHLSNPGYSTEFLFDYKRKDIKANRLRIKEWDYYYINNKDYALCLTIADNSYMALASVTFIDFKQCKDITRSQMKFFTMGKTNMPSTSKVGDVYIKMKNVCIRFGNDGKERVLTCIYKDFVDNKILQAKVTLTDEPKESMVIATPFPKDKKAFYYNQKINCMRASGVVQIGEEKYIFNKSDTLGTLDWGRGVWTYKNTWYWGSASAVLPNGDLFGFNIGYGFGDTTNATENMVFLNGKAHKLSHVTFNIPQKKEKDDFMHPSWTFTSNDNRFQMDFIPLLNRYANMNALILRSVQNQIFGYFSGKVVLDDDTELEIKNVLGFAEKVYNKW